MYVYKGIFRLRYFAPQVPIPGKILNGYPMFSVKNIVQNVKLIELWDKTLVPLHFVIFKSNFFLIFPIGCKVKVRVIYIQRIMTIS